VHIIDYCAITVILQVLVENCLRGTQRHQAAPQQKLVRQAVRSIRSAHEVQGQSELHGICWIQQVKVVRQAVRSIRSAHEVQGQPELHGVCWIQRVKVVRRAVPKRALVGQHRGGTPRELPNGRISVLLGVK